MSTTVVLVHGGFVDESGWRGAYDQLRADGLDVRIVQHATRSLADDAAATRPAAGQRLPPPRPR